MSSTEILTVEEAAERLKLNPQTLRRWIRAGLLPARKIGRKEYRIDARDLEERVGGLSSRGAARRTEAVQALLALRERLQGRGISVAALLAESREELEARGGAGGR